MQLQQRQVELLEQHGFKVEQAFWPALRMVLRGGVQRGRSGKRHYLK
jgi:hypothetical protein